jgi:hypothetical protein
MSGSPILSLAIGLIVLAAPTPTPQPDLSLMGSQAVLKLDTHQAYILSAGNPAANLAYTIPALAFYQPPPPKRLPVLASAQVSRNPAPEPPAEVHPYFHTYASQFNLDPGKLERIANCESHFHTTSDTGTYGGMFQFSASTWRSTRNDMGLDPDPALRFNAEEAVRTAAFKISHGGLSAWPVCGQR